MSSDDKKIHATILLEMLGRPPEHLTKELEALIVKIKEEKGIKVIDQKVNEPKSVEEHENFFTTFAELDIELDGIKELIVLTFKYMPSHIEIVSPEKLHFTNNDLNETVNEITRRLHAYDQVARVLQNEKGILEKQLKDLKDKGEEKK